MRLTAPGVSRFSFGINAVVDDPHDGPHGLLSAGQFDLLRRWWWGIATVCGLAGLIASGATIWATREMRSAQTAADVATATTGLERANVRIDGISETSRTIQLRNEAADEHFARIEGVLSALTTASDRAHDDLAALRQTLAVEQERTGWLFDRAAASRTPVKH